MKTNLSIKKRIGLLCLFLIAAGSQLKAQEDFYYLPRLADWSLPTPTSWEYTRHTGYQPDLSTGAIDISIPLYTVSHDDLSWPIELRYHSNGIKVTDNYFPLGYGWTLSPGLRITRTILGKADEVSTMDVRTGNYTFEYLWGIQEPDNKTDAQPDIYTIHLPGHETAFLMESQGGQWKVSAANSLLRIEPDFDTYRQLSGFTVTDDKGILYKFGGEYVEDDQTTGYPTGWMLYEVQLPGSGNTRITLNWQKQSVVCNAELLLNNYVAIRDHYYEQLEEPGSTGPGFTDYIAPLDYDYPTVSLFLPAQITLPDRSIVSFDYYQYLQRPFLSGLSVTNPDGKEVKHCTFSYQNYKRLGGVYVSGEGRYTFEYYVDSEEMDTRSQDFWGYYNGKNNATLVPSFEIWIESFSSRIYTYKGADRTINATAMQNNMLKKITYPTRGYMEVEYEPHRFAPRRAYDLLIDGEKSGMISEGGGLRVKRTVSAPCNGAPEVVRTYKYGPDENGEGNTFVRPELRWFMDEQYFYHSGSSAPYLHDLAYRQLLITGVPSYSYLPTFNPFVWYDTVTEYEGDHKTVRLFETITNGTSVMSQGTERLDETGNYAPLYVSYYGNLAQKGSMLLSELLYRKEGDSFQMTEKREYKYRWHGMPEVKATLSRRVYGNIDSGDGDFPISDYKAVTGGFYVGDYRINLHEYQLSQETVTTYCGTDSIVTVHSMDRESKNGRKALLKEESWTDSRGNTYSDCYYYPDEEETATLMTAAQRTAIPQLKAKNRLSVPLVQIRKKNGVELSRKTVQYKDYGNGLLLPEKEFYRQDGATEETRVEYQRYDAYGHLLGAVKDNLEKTVWLWGYGSRYPVARIKGASYAEVESWLGTSAIAALSSNTASVPTALDGIREQLESKPVQVTTYTYIPLVGIESVTAPNGEKTSYLYDGEGRLTEVRNHDGKATEQYEYHTKE